MRFRIAMERDRGALQPLRAAGVTTPKIVNFTWPLVTTALVVLNSLGGCTNGVAPPAELDTKRIVAADGEPGNWLTHGPGTRRKWPGTRSQKPNYLPEMARIPSRLARV